MDEFLLWEGKANLKMGLAKIVGNLKITNKRIEFISRLKKINIDMGKIEKVEIVKKVVKRIKITADKQYLFFVPHAENVAELIKRFSK